MADGKRKSSNKINNFEDLFLKWWKRNKIKICILSVIISFTVGFNLFLYQWVIIPVSEKRVLEAKKDYIFSSITLIGYFNNFGQSFH